MDSISPDQIPLAAKAIPFWEYIEKGTIPKEFLSSEYIAQQFVERLVHYILGVPSRTYSMTQLATLLEQLDPRQQVYFFSKLKETSPHSLKEFAPLYYGFMAEFHPLLFT